MCVVFGSPAPEFDKRLRQLDLYHIFRGMRNFLARFNVNPCGFEPVTNKLQTHDIELILVQKPCPHTNHVCWSRIAVLTHNGWKIESYGMTTVRYKRHTRSPRESLAGTNKQTHVNIWIAFVPPAPESRCRHPYFPNTLRPCVTVEPGRVWFPQAFQIK